MAAARGPLSATSEAVKVLNSSGNQFFAKAFSASASLQLRQANQEIKQVSTLHQKMSGKSLQKCGAATMALEAVNLLQPEAQLNDAVHS